MARQTTTLPLPLVPREPGVPLARWLAGALRAEILAGRLRPGARVPSTRELSRQYGVSRGTVVNVFEELHAEGYLVGDVGSGTRVNRVLPDELLRVGARQTARRALKAPKRSLSDYAQRVVAFPESSQRATRAFRANLPALDLFPTTVWSQIASRRLRRATTSQLAGCHTFGYWPLREAIADYLRTSRGVKCDAEQVAIVSGTQEAFYIVAHLVLNSGDTVCMEDPGCLGAALAFTAVGAKIQPVSVDDEGMQVPSSATNARLAYVTPAHQFPLGVAMSLARRIELLAWARASGALIFEDDYDSEYRYAGKPTLAMQGLDQNGVVLFAGSFSKVLFPSLRLGYLVVPSDLIEPVARIKSVIDLHTPVLTQSIVCDFITEGHFGRHMRRMREVYASRFDALRAGVQERLDGLLELVGIDAGLQAAAWLPAGVSADAVSQQAASRDVEVVPLSAYSRRRMKRDGLQLGFAAVDAKEIERGVRELARILGRDEEVGTRS